MPHYLTTGWLPSPALEQSILRALLGEASLPSCSMTWGWVRRQIDFGM